MTQVPAGELLRLRGRTANEKTMGNAFRLRLAKVAVGKLVQGVWGRDVVHLRLSTGLPVDHMRDADELKEVAEAYPQTKLVPNAQMANARGYLYYANFAQRED